jgi:hypothetical protein
MAYRRLGWHLIVVHGADAPTKEEWTNYLATTRQLDVEKQGQMHQLSALVFTDGGGPNSTQRVELNRVIGGREARTAIVTDSVVVRGIVGALSLFNPKGLAVYPPKSWKDAATFCRLEQAQHMEVLKVAFALGREVGDPKVLRSLAP